MINAITTEPVRFQRANGRFDTLQQETYVVLTFVPKASTVVQNTGKLMVTKEGSFWAVLEDTVVMLDKSQFKTLN